MSDIKVKADELEDFASQIGKAERECNDTLDAINWHFSSLLANFPGVVPGSIHNLEADLKYSIKKYKSKLDDAQQLIKLTAASMKNDEQKMSGKVGEFLLELVGWYDIQRVFSEYDPVTGEKLSAGDRVLAVGFLALTFVPPAKAVGVGGKAAVPGVKAGLPSLAKTPEAFMKIRNVLDPEKVQQAFRSVYNEVVKGPIAATKVWFDKIKKGIGDIPIPQIRQEAFAGVGVVNKTVRDAFGDAKDFIQRIKSSQVDEVEVKGVTGVEGVTKGTKEVKMTSSGNSKHSRDVNIPSVRNNEFNEWFDNLPAKEFEEMWNDPKLRIKIEDRIRQPGGYHEWHLVARTPKFKQWGISMDDIKEMRSLTKDVEFVNPPGRHGSRGSTKAHNEILKIIDNASDYESFVKGLNEWSKNRMKNGIMDLPEGLRR